MEMKGVGAGAAHVMRRESKIPVTDPFPPVLSEEISCIVFYLHSCQVFHEANGWQDEEGGVQMSHGVVTQRAFIFIHLLHIFIVELWVRSQYASTFFFLSMPMAFADVTAGHLS